MHQVLCYIRVFMFNQCWQRVKAVSYSIYTYIVSKLMISSRSINSVWMPLLISFSVQCDQELFEKLKCCLSIIFVCLFFFHLHDSYFIFLILFLQLCVLLSFQQAYNATAVIRQMKKLVVNKEEGGGSSSSNHTDGASSSHQPSSAPEAKAGSSAE